MQRHPFGKNTTGVALALQLPLQRLVYGCAANHFYKRRLRGRAPMATRSFNAPPEDGTLFQQTFIMLVGIIWWRFAGAVGVNPPHPCLSAGVVEFD